MKCVSMLGSEQIQRLTDKQADYVVKRKEGKYVSKSEWKKQVRKIVEKVEEKIDKKKEKEIKERDLRRKERELEEAKRQYENAKKKLGIK